MRSRVLVVFVDALGPEQVERLGGRFDGFGHRRALEGVLGYSSGALATLLTGALPRVHGRMCLFRRAGAEGSSLAPLRWLGLLPKVVHERGAFRRWVAARFAQYRGYGGYFALHKVPPEAFAWLDVPERDDLFQSADIDGSPTFLARARAAGLRVYATPWQTPEPARFARALEVLSHEPPDLSFLYATELDAALHAEGHGGPKARAAMARIEAFVAAARDRLARGGARVLTYVVGDHGMAEVGVGLDPSPLRRRTTARVFVDATMARFWGSAAELARARLAVERLEPEASWLDRGALEAAGAPVEGSPYGDAIAVLPEGAIFAPSDIGGFARGMHGYAPGSPSTRAALLSDEPLDAGLGSLASLAPRVERHLGLEVRA